MFEARMPMKEEGRCNVDLMLECLSGPGIR